MVKAATKVGNSLHFLESRNPIGILVLMSKPSSSFEEETSYGEEIIILLDGAVSRLRILLTILRAHVFSSDLAHPDAVPRAKDTDNG